MSTVGLTATTRGGSTTGSVKLASGGGITHGQDLTINDVGPWSLQGVAKGSESLTTLATPPRGYFRTDTPADFCPTSQIYVYNNDPGNLGGVVPAGGLVIDGISVPAGTYVCQFRDIATGDFYSQGVAAKFLFRGCRWNTEDWGGGGLFNDYTAPASFQVFMAYCSLTGSGGTETVYGPYVKHIGGSGHYYLRNYWAYSATFIQPNVDGVHIVENLIEKYVYPYGESGTSGQFDSTVSHLNGISVEGGLPTLYILRNSILAESPDGCTGSLGTAAGQPGYGTQPGQTGYGAGSAPGRLVTQTDCIALFTSNGTQWNSKDVQVCDNFIGGAGYCLYVEGTPHNVKVTGNRVSTKWWTSGGSHGAAALGTISDGVNGCHLSGNVWADDYGTGGDGATLAANRQYPNGNGPRVGSVAF